MTGDIRNHVSTYEACREYEQSQTKETLKSHQTASRPWQYVAADLSCLGSYAKPNIDENQLEVASATFLEALLSILKCKSIRMQHSITVSLDHDIIRFVFGNNGTPSEDKFIVYENDDFSRLCLPPFWHYYFELGQGVQVDFPVKLKTQLSFKSKRYFIKECGTLEKRPFIPYEKVCLVSNRKACSAKGLI